MNYFKAAIRIIRRLVWQELYSDPKRAVALYRKKGVTIGDNTELYNTEIDSIRPFLVSIGSNVLITSTKILTHDASTKKFLGYTKIGKVTIGNNVFIGANCLILPNCHIGSNVIVGAGTVVSKDIPDNSVVVGNPMRVVGSLDDNVLKNETALKSCPVFAQNYSMTDEEKRDMTSQLDVQIGFVKSEE